MQANVALTTLKWYYASICFGLALIFCSQYFTYKNLRDLSLNNEGVTTTIGILNQTANFGLTTKDFLSNTRGYIITHDQELLSENYKKRVQIVEISDTLFNLVKSDQIQTKKIKELLAISSEIVAFTHKIVTIDRTLGTETAIAHLKKGEGKRLNKLLDNKIHEIEIRGNDSLSVRWRLVHLTQRNSTYFILTTGFIGFVITILAGIFLVRDQRKQRNMQQEINTKERVLKQYLEAIPDGVMVINAAKEIVLLNQSGKEILGISGRNLETLEQELKEIKLLDPLTSHIRYTTDTLPVSRGLLGEKLIGNKIDLVKNNVIYHLETNVQPIVGLNGNITNSITVFRDITERANYETMLEKSRILAEKSVKIKDVFLSNMSHEIRTPLNAIIGFTNLLISQLTNAKDIEYAEYIQTASKSLLELINDILDFSKIEAGQIILEKTPASIPELTHSISVIINQWASEKGIRFDKHLASDLPEMIETDKLRLTQILLNVCGNAVKFTQKGAVKLTVKPAGQIVDGHQTIIFEVEDTGIGIPADKIGVIFNRFVQASESTTRIFGGTGLGLSIVKSLVELLGGSITVKSELGKGSTFTMKFSLKIVTEIVDKKDLAKVMESSNSITTIKVLAAEDNILNQKLLKALFSRLKISVTIVNNGLEAIKKLQNAEEHFDIILMDIQMPIMDGYTAIKEIRSNISRDIPIITMTAHAMVGEKEECLSIGANSYISKPFNESELIITIAQLTSVEHLQSPEKVITSKITNKNEIVNLQYLHEITGNDAELQSELILLFEKESPTHLASIIDSANDNNLEKLEKHIHKFRSSLFSVGLLSTANKFKELEASLKIKIWNEEMKNSLAVLKAESELGLIELKKLRTIGTIQR